MTTPQDNKQSWLEKPCHCCNGAIPNHYQGHKCKTPEKPEEGWEERFDEEFKIKVITKNITDVHLAEVMEKLTLFPFKQFIRSELRAQAERIAIMLEKQGGEGEFMAFLVRQKYLL